MSQQPDDDFQMVEGSIDDVRELLDILELQLPPEQVKKVIQIVSKQTEADLLETADSIKKDLEGQKQRIDLALAVVDNLLEIPGNCAAGTFLKTLTKAMRLHSEIIEAGSEGLKAQHAWVYHKPYLLDDKEAAEMSAKILVRTANKVKSCQEKIQQLEVNKHLRNLQDELIEEILEDIFEQPSTNAPPTSTKD
jgi:hypothetical protein